MLREEKGLTQWGSIGYQLCAALDESDVYQTNKLNDTQCVLLRNSMVKVYTSFSFFKLLRKDPAKESTVVSGIPQKDRKPI